jgi:hypothetical protein
MRFAPEANGMPALVFGSVDPHEHRVDEPAPMLEIPHDLDPVSPDLSREDGSGPVPPKPGRFTRNVDAALVQILDVPKREWKADLLHQRQADDLGARLEAEENAGVAHARKAGGSRSGTSRFSSDSAADLQA